MREYSDYFFEDKMINNVDKMKVYLKDEDLEFENIKDTFNEINSGYKTENTDLLANISAELINKMKMIQKIHSDDITVFNANIQNYIDFTRKHVENLKSSEDVIID